LRALIDTLGPGDNVGLRNATVEALGGFGRQAVEALDEAIPELDADGRKLAAEALGRSGSALALVPLRRLIADADPNVQAAAVESVAAIGSACTEQAVPILQSCLELPDRLLRLAAINGLNQLGVVLPWSSVEALMNDPLLERSALAAAGRTASARAAPLLVHVLESGAPSAVSPAILSLVDLVRGGEHTHLAVREALSSLPPSTVAQLFELARGRRSEPDVQRGALVLLGLLGTRQAAEVAADALADVHVAAEAEEALASLGIDAIEVLVERINSADGDARVAALELVGRLAGNPAPPEAIAAARGALGAESSEQVRAALSALASIGDADCLGAIVPHLDEPATGSERLAAAAAIAAIARRHPEAAREIARSASRGAAAVHAALAVIAALGAPGRGSLAEDVAFASEALSNESAFIRRAAMEALAELGSDLGAEAVAFALTDEDRAVQLSAVRALGRMRSASGVSTGVGQLLLLVERSEDEALVVAAIRALGDAEDPRALAALKPLVRSESARRAVAAVEAVARLPESRRIDALIDALSHQDSEVVKAALRALSEEFDARVSPHLGACLDHDAWDVRRLAADLLGRSGKSDYLGLLRAKLVVENEPLVKEAIVRALGELEASSGVRRSPPPSRIGSLRSR
jgi:HEAT repeat protein